MDVSLADCMCVWLGPGFGLEIRFGCLDEYLCLFVCVSIFRSFTMNISVILTLTQVHKPNNNIPSQNGPQIHIRNSEPLLRGAIFPTTIVPGLAWLDNTHRETSKKPRSYLATPDQAILNRLACDLISLSLSLSLPCVCVRVCVCVCVCERERERERDQITG